MAKILTLAEINRVLPDIDVVSEIAAGFVAFSQGKVDVPPVGELLFPEASGEMHVKYGAIRGDDVFVVKIATGFFQNGQLGLPPFSGCMLVFSQTTGMVLAVLLEEGELTNHRTAAAGAVAAKHLAPSQVTQIGICGSGVQARLQADYLRRVTECRDLVLWARDSDRRAAAVRDIQALGYRATAVDSAAAVAQHCNLIVTTTAAHTFFLRAEHVRPGTHVTAMGSDTPEKNELDPALLAKADRVVADSKSQCLSRGEIFRAIKAGALNPESVVELGAVIAGTFEGRRSDTDITIADLTGVAVQDIMIAKAVMKEIAGGAR